MKYENLYTVLARVYGEFLLSHHVLSVEENYLIVACFNLSTIILIKTSTHKALTKLMFYDNFKKIGTCSLSKLFDTQVARRGRQYHCNPPPYKNCPTKASRPTKIQPCNKNKKIRKSLLLFP